MVRLRRSLIALLTIVGLAATAADGSALAEPSAFQDWLQDVRREAAAAGISSATLDAALSDLAPIERIVELDRRQPEYTQTFWAYLDKRVTPERIARGRALLAEHGDLLARVQARYGVQARFLVAFWGLESNFGDYTGGFPVIGALATLAYDERRSDFFRRELLNALRILDAGHVTPAAMQGSWAGAMGQVQFMPSTFVSYAVDFDGDGRRDIWNSLPDIFASAANYLSQIGWQGDVIWGREIRLPQDFDWELAAQSERKPLAAWAALGVRRADGGPLPEGDIEAAIVLPAGHAGPAFLVYDNFSAILTWNRSLLYALSVGHLADRLVGAGPLLAERPAIETPLSRAQVEELQALLMRLGFDPGTPDGVVGSKTRAALRAFQRDSRLAPDGYPTPEVLQALREAAARQGQEAG